MFLHGPGIVASCGRVRVAPTKPQADRCRFDRSSVPRLSPPPPHTTEQLCEWMEKWCKPNAPLHGDHDEAVARLSTMRERFLERDRRRAGRDGA